MYQTAMVFCHAGRERRPFEAGVLDLANYLSRRGIVKRHPAADRVQSLADLLGALVLRLQRIEEQPQEFAAAPRDLTLLVGEGVGLVVSLCDTLAQIGDPAVVGKLHQAADLAHRWVRTEAGAALARLGDKRGVVLLVELAAAPLVRSRALKYLEELGDLEQADAQYRTPVARAEGDLAAWLAEPSHFGIPPTSLTLIDERRQFWPGFETPVECFLFDAEFRHGPTSFSTIAIAGPLTHALAVDLEDLPPDDIYAVYAGWQAEHPDMQEVPADRLAFDQNTAWQHLAEQLAAAGYRDVQLVKLTRFFEALHWVATARRGEVPGVVICDAGRVEWYTIVTPGPRALTATEFYYLHKGRQLLRTFNREAS